MSTNIIFDYGELVDIMKEANGYISAKAKEREFGISKEGDLNEFIFNDNKNEFSLDWLQIVPTKKDVYEYMSNLQSWTGYVVDISDNDFSAKLIDKKDPTTYEVATFNKKDVSDGDLSLIKPGAIFYWSIGYATNKGQRIKQSLIRFKRSGDIPVANFDHAIDKAKELQDGLLWD